MLEVRPIRQIAVPLAGFAALFVALGIALYPAAAMESALRGISIWWNVLFPALFPFLVISEIMLGFGLVHFLGALLDPLMRPLFRVPGIGGFVMAMGFASGYPVAAKLTARLREQRLVTRTEGERLISFCTTSDPLFLIGAVSIGFFHNPAFAALLAITHYGAAVLLGFVYRYHGHDGKSRFRASRGWIGGDGGRGEARSGKEAGRRRSVLRQAFAAMHAARLEDGRPIGKLLQDAVFVSLPLIMTIGGLVVFFSVIMEMLRMTGVLAGLFAILHGIMEAAGFPAVLAQSIVNGLFEVTLGAQAAGEASAHTPLRYSAAAAAFVLSWAGLSVHAQVLSLISRTDMRYGPFMTARLLHGIASAAIMFLAWPILAPLAGHIADTWLAAEFAYDRMPSNLPWSMHGSAIVFASSLALILLIGLPRLLARPGGRR